jgi:hypothetical protein
MTNLKEIFEANVKASPDKQCLGTRARDGEYTWKSLKEIYELSK